MCARLLWKPVASLSASTFSFASSDRDVYFVVSSWRLFVHTVVIGRRSSLWRSAMTDIC